MKTLAQRMIGLTALLFAGALWACSSGSDSDIPPTTVEQEEFFSSYAQALCDTAKPCCAQEGFSTNARCVDDTIDQLRSASQKAMEGQNGAALFHKDRAEKCLSALRAASGSCVADDAAVDGLTACGHVLTGDLERGQPCSHDSQCRSEGKAVGACLGELASDGTPQLVCRAVGFFKKGQVCGGDSVKEFDLAACEAGTYCNPSSLRCEPSPGPGASCEVSQTCAEGFCNPSTHQCEAKLADGNFCDSPAQCLSGLCAKGSCQSASRPGDSCTRDSDSCLCLMGRCHDPHTLGRAPGCTVSNPTAARQ